MRWGIMGLGHIAREFAEALASKQGIYAVASRDLAKSCAFKDEYGAVKAYGSYEEMLRDHSVEAVYVATVNSRHFADVRACLEHGKHVLCEKAIWGDYDELLELQDLARKGGLVLAEAMTIFHMPLFKKIANMIENDNLGTIKMVKADLGSLKEDDPANRFFSRELGGGAMLDIGTYALSFLRYFLRGSFDEIRCVTQAYQTGVDEMWAISLHTSEDMIGCANLAFRAKLPKRAIVAGDKAYVTVDNYVRAEEATLVYPDGTSSYIACGKTSDALAYEIEDFERAVSGDLAATCFDMSLDVVKTMDGLLRKRGYKS
ncbi:Gfo/Idh/MocA family protein [Thermophilibacter immobilis]|uniref:Gfo/Idh/MocA family oxidoreductase n=1 Tax=Thermophilibacter immobilis TaxID=2779519 RepID=A0A7S7M8D5_9ACTN|nr:Gfo/Idh/MocA family oxidoreductase [Thermophilibacter immobilis]QOY60337.1 Gfo/Idh/MocA family oxidoreductase [Thermophilibacter immobilis]